jgi:hypothetical protein
MTPGPRSRIALAGDPFDRSAHRRANADWVETAAAADSSVFLAVQGSRNLVSEDSPARPALLDADAASALATTAHERILLGLRDERAYFALALPADGGEPPAGYAWRDLRWIGAELRRRTRAR